MSTLGIGIVGAGWMGNVHAEGWHQNAPDARVVAVADVSAPRARQIVDLHTGGDVAIHPDIDALLADPRVDAVDICLPHHLHLPAIVAAARAGKAILSEKPLCTSFAELNEIGAVLEETGAILMVAHNQLFAPSVVEARRMLRIGAFGRPYVVRSVEAGQNRRFGTGWMPVRMPDGVAPWGWRLDPGKMGGGEVLDTGWHGIYRLIALADDRPVEVFAYMNRYLLEQLPTEDTGALLVRFASGMIGELLTSWAFGLVGGAKFEVAAEFGSLAGTDDVLSHQFHGWSQPVEQRFPPVNSFAAELGHFVEVVRGTAEPEASFRHAARVLQVVDAAYRSVESGCAVVLPEDPTVPGEPATSSPVAPTWQDARA